LGILYALGLIVSIFLNCIKPAGESISPCQFPFYRGIQKPFAIQKMLSIGFIKNHENWSVFFIKIKFQNLGKENRKYEWFFSLSIGF
jgi:hypothetical protein